MKRSKKICKTLFLAICALTILCANPTSTMPVRAQTYVPVTGVSIKASTGLMLHARETLTPTITPANATYKTVHWSSSNSSVARVDQNGEVTACGVGTAIITATTDDGSKTARCTVTVSLMDIAVTSISPSPSSIRAGDTVTFYAVIRNMSDVPFDGIFPIYVDVYVDGKNIGRDSFYRYDMQSGAMKVLALTPKWTATFGTHQVQVVVNPAFPYDETSHPFTESDYANNSLKTRFTVLDK